MTGQALIGFLVFYFVTYYNSERASANCVDKTTLTDVLNALLSHHQWARITDPKAKHPDYTKRFAFTGKEVFIDRGLFSGARAIGNPHVSVENVYEKYYMVVNLLACVYACAADKFTSLIKTLLHLSANEKRKSQNSAYQIRKKKRQLENVVDQEETHWKRTRVKYHDGLNDFTSSWRVFNFTYQQLLSGQKMFEHMYVALKHLLNLAPPEKQFVRFMMNVEKVLLLVQWYKDIALNVTSVLPTYVGEEDVDYASKLGKFSSELFKSIKVKSTFLWEPFVLDYCMIPPKNDQPITRMIQVFQIESPGVDRANIMYRFENQIKELAESVINNYCLNLGFVLQ